jgi:sulfur dioxygenase
LREEQERKKHGIIPGSLHVPYPSVQASLRSDGPLRRLAQADKRLVFYCAYGERSAMALQAAQAAGFTTARHLHGGMQAWKRAGGAVASQ